MAFIRDRHEERTGFQSGSNLIESTDCQCDFVMVYRLDSTTAERIKEHKEKGYVVHLMTGISWGHYTDYLYGRWDGINHWDEAQTDRFGNIILHSPDVPYMVPTISFSDFLTEQLRLAVDAGVEAIHVEEPEFWDRAGYSEAFKREYELYYRTPWVAPHESVDAKYKCSKLKAYLFSRTIDRLASSLKEYAKTKYSKNLRFYVPTHSLLNYTQWKIISPEGKLADIPSVDGCIAQVWTGTSREKNWYNGVFKERTFETAYLEYGIMQELVKGTGRRMWFLHDPIEDNPIFDWNDYRKNYFCTVSASLLHPNINHFEICPWPNRVFEGSYPKNAPNSITIPEEYATLLNNSFNTLGTLENSDDKISKIGILTGDCQLYQREYPDSCFSYTKQEQTGTVLHESDELISKFKEILFDNPAENSELMLEYMSTNALPSFYSLSLPLLKYGVPIRPILLDNARRYTGYLDDYKVIIMSYEFMKPDYPDINTTLAAWVRSGGTLIYIGDGSDPFHNISSWWTGKFKNAAEHLFEMLEITPDDKGIYTCGKGIVGIWKCNPCIFSFSEKNANLFREFYKDVISKKGISSQFSNSLTVKRNPYIITAVMDESINDEPLVLEGIYSDMFTPAFNVITKKIISPGENSMLLDYNCIRNEEIYIIGTSSRIEAMSRIGNIIKLIAHGAGNLNAYIRIKLPQKPKSIIIDGTITEFSYETKAGTVLINYKSYAKPINIDIKM